MNHITSKFSNTLITIYKPLVKEIPSYVEDRNDFLNKVKDIDKIPEETYLVTMDVKFLSTNIPNPEDIAATKRALR